METYDLSCDSSTIRVYKEGYESARPALLVSGFVGVASFWKPILAALSTDRPIFSYDQRGTGASGPFGSHLSMEKMVEDALNVLESIGQPSVHLIGHSAGAGVAMALAARCRSKVASLTLICGWTRADTWMRRVFLARLDSLDAKGEVAYMETTSLFMRPARDFRVADGEWHVQEQKALLNFPGRADIHARSRAVLEWDSISLLGKIACPCLVVGSADDNMTPYYFSEDLANEIPGAILVCLNDGGHYCVQSRPKETVAPILDFLVTEDLTAI